MRLRNVSITEEIIKEVKANLLHLSQRQIANKLGVSQYTVWCVANGKYDRSEDLQHERKIKQSYFIHQ